MSGELCVWLFSLTWCAVVVHGQEFLGKQQQLTNDSSCTPWREYNHTSGECECGDGVSDVIRCSDSCSELALKTCYCMTHSEALHMTLVSYCIYTCSIDIRKEFRPVTAVNTTTLNKDTCGLYNRTGLMCGECVEGYAPSVYSYNVACVECSNTTYHNWIKYIVIAYVPLTIFFVVVIVLRIPITSGVMVAYVTLSQLSMAPGLVTFYSARFERASIKRVNIVLALYGIWNLDFFRSLYTPFCLHPKLNTVHVICLDYLIAVYPLLLILLTYFLVQLHDRVRVVMLLWKPVYKCIYRFRKEWNIKESLIKAFATFIILSYVKIMNVSIEILTPAHNYRDIHGKTINKRFLYCNGSMEYWGKEHVPYAILAIVMSTIFNFLPLILTCAYPCRCFQKLLNLLPCQLQALHIFMDTLQGCYKEQPKDYRCFAGLFIGLRMVNLVLYAYFKNQLYCLYVALVMVVFVVLIALNKPYKNNCYNTLDSCLFVIGIAFYTTYSIRVQSVYIAPKESTHIRTLIESIGLSAVLLLPLYGLGLLCYRLLPILTLQRFAKRVCRRLHHILHVNQQQQELGQSCDLHKREGYTQLL